MSMQTTVQPAARAEALRKVYGTGGAAVEALRGVSIEIAAAEWTAIMGPSGSGKSTLLHILAGLDSPTEGKVFIGDVDLTTLNDKQLTQLRRDRVGFVFQAFNLIPTLTAEENITLPLDIAGTDVDRGWFDTVVDTVGIRDRLGHRPTELSGGQQQRVAGARALVSRPEIIFADEPTGNLDSKSGAELLDFLRARRRRARSDDRDGDARRARGRPRRPGRVPGGRQHRGRDPEPTAERDLGSDQVDGGLRCSARRSRACSRASSAWC